jgi:hypothetical protein
MNQRVVIMTEEESMNAFLRKVLPKAFPDRRENVDWLLIPHPGKSALEASIPKKVRAWREPGVRFMIVRDNDGANCADVKARLLERIPASSERPIRVRIVCQQLESWLLGDSDAIVAAFATAGRHPSFRTWTARNPDELTNAAQLVQELTGTRAKVSRAGAIASHIDPSRNRSHSLGVFLDGLSQLFA